MAKFGRSGEWLFSATLLLVALIGALCVQSNEQANKTASATIKQDEKNNKTQLVNDRTQNDSIEASNLLQAEESRQVLAAVSVVAAEPEEARAQVVKRPPLSFLGGAGNSYMSISRDGSNRYEFGYDTTREVESAKLAEAQLSARPARPRNQARLMREESRLEDGTVIGRYGYTDPFNVFRVVQYVAGPDGYFATEDVGAMSADESGEPSLRRKPLQLNRQLHKALEQARSLRAAKRSASQAGRQARLAGEAGEQVASQRRPVEPARARRNEELLLASGSHQSVRYATRINHLVGNNGLTYATAFRPQVLVANSNVPQQAVESAQSEPMYPSTRVISSSSPANHEASRLAHLAELRSKLPAPAYSVPQLLAPLESKQHLSSPVLRTHHAWNLLTNNYNDNFQSSSLIIDHSNGELTDHFAPVSTRAGAEFNREASILASIAQRQGKKAASPPLQLPPQQVPQPPQAQTTGTHFESRFGARTSSPSVESSANYNYAFALKHFDAPLYRPEVHETHVDESGAAHLANKSLGAPVAGPIFNYVSTIVHPEISPKPDYNTLQHIQQPQQQFASELKPEMVNTDSSAYANLAPIAYATRLSSSPRSVLPLGGQLSFRSNFFANDNEELSMEDSEQVAAYSSNGTVSRARIPDRSKKLSSIFKARQAALDSGSTSDNSGSSSSARIRRPVPVNSKRQFGSGPAQQNAALRVETNNQQDSEASRPISANLEKELQSATAKDEAKANKKFGSYQPGSPAVGNDPASLQSEEQANVFKAKKRPQLRITNKDKADPIPETGSSTTRRPDSVLKQAKSSPVLPNEVLAEVALPVSVRSQLQISESETRVAEKPLSIKSDSDVELSKAVIIDTTAFQSNKDDQSANNSNKLNKDLIQKIMRIQQEIASKASGAKIPSPQQKELENLNTNERSSNPISVSLDHSNYKPSTATTSTTTSTTSTTSTTTTTTTTKAPQTTTTLPSPSPTTIKHDLTTTYAPIISNTASTTIAPSTKPSSTSPSTSSSTSTTSTTTAPPSVPTTVLPVTASATEVPLTLISESNDKNDKNHPEEVKANGHKWPNNTDTSESKSFLTGPLIKSINVDTAQDTDDMMVSFVRDVEMSFESSRAVPMIMPRAVQPPTPKSNQVDIRQPSTTTTSASISNSTIAPVLVRELTTTSKAPSLEQTSTDRPMKVKNITFVAPKVDEDDLLLELNTSSRSLANKENSNETIKNLTINIAENGDVPNVQASNSSVSNDLLERNLNLVSNGTSAESIVKVSATQSIVSSTTRRPQAVRSTSSSQPSRFGRLVIKRGDKIVARYNATDPIPDNLIPVGGLAGDRSQGEQVIVPDMPRIRTRTGTLAGGFIKRLQRPTSGLQPGPNWQDQTNTTVASTAPPTASQSAQVSANVAAQSANSSSAQAQVSEIQKVASNDGTLSSKLAPPAVDGSNRLEVRRGLLRGARSYPSNRYLIDDNEDLMTAESKPESSSPAREMQSEKERSSRSSTVAQVANRTGESRLQAVNGGPRGSFSNNWSNRLRDSIYRQMARKTTTKRYDEQEDLKKLVEKITSIEESRGELGADEPRRSVKMLVASEDVNMTALQGTHLKPDNQSALSIAQVRAEPINLPPPPALPPVARSSLVNVSTRGANSAEEQPKRANATVMGIPAHKIAASSQSTSLSFTLQMSPELERKWDALKPINSTSSFGNASRSVTEVASNVRIDSRGFIHVRNNQSLTVHVDIEPPSRKSLQPELAVVREQSKDLNRTSSIGTDERSRIKQVRSILSGQSMQQPSKESAATNLSQVLDRRPRMLCVEVENRVRERFGTRNDPVGSSSMKNLAPAIKISPDI